MIKSQDDNTNTQTKSTTEKAPAFQFYPKDFLTDGKVLCMSNEVVGMYIKLLSIDWLEDGFPRDLILKLAGFEWYAEYLEVREDFKEIEAQLAECFVAHPTKPGVITNPRLQKERQRQQERRIERSAAGKKGALIKESKRLQDEAELEHSLSLASAKSSSSSSSSSSFASSNKSILTREVVCEIAPPAAEPKIEKPEKIKKPLVAPFAHVRLTSEEVAKVKALHPDKAMREYYYKAIDDWFDANPKKRSRDCYRTILAWIRRDKVEGKGWFTPKKQPYVNERPQRQGFTPNAVEGELLSIYARQGKPKDI